MAPTSRPLPMKEHNDNYYKHETAVVDAGAQIGAGTRVWHFSHIMPEAVIGADCIIGQNCFVANKVVLGDRVKVQNNVSLYEGLVCDDDVFIGPSAVFTNVINPRSAVNRKEEFKPTVLEKGVTIGANATIICGHRLGSYAFIGAGAVITSDVPAYALFVGNPGKFHGWMSQNGQQLNFNEEGFAVCSETGQTYALQNQHVSLVEQ